MKHIKIITLFLGLLFSGFGFGSEAREDGEATGPRKVLTLPPHGEIVAKSQGIYYRFLSKRPLKNTIYLQPKFVEVKPRNVSINLMWVNKEIAPENKFIGGKIKRENKPFEAVIPEQVAKWMVLNPESDVVLWYDSMMCTELQSTNTYGFIQNLLKGMKRRYPTLPLSLDKFSMKDLRTLQLVKRYSEAFTNYVPIYTRVNAFRLIAAIEYNELNVIRKVNSAFIYADYTVNPHSYKEVYPGMSEDGFIGIKSRLQQSSGFENSFMIIGNQNKYTLGVLKDLVAFTSKRINDELLEMEPEVMINDKKSSQSFFDNRILGFNESFLYDLSRSLLLIAKIRQSLNQKPSLYNFKPEGFHGEKIINEILRFRDPFEIFSDEGVEVKFELPMRYPNLAFTAVVDDPRVSITRASGHGDTGVIIKSPEKLETLVSRSIAYS